MEKNEAEGIKQLCAGIIQDGRIRTTATGRKPLAHTRADIAQEACLIADPKGNPENPIRWTSYFMEHIANVMSEKGSSMSVYRILKTDGFALKANKKTIEGKRHMLIGTLKCFGYILFFLASDEAERKSKSW